MTDRNMFGLRPCPVCDSIYRWPTQDGYAQCDDCGDKRKHYLIDNSDWEYEDERRKT